MLLVHIPSCLLPGTSQVSQQDREGADLISAKDEATEARAGAPAAATAPGGQAVGRLGAPEVPVLPRR